MSFPPYLEAEYESGYVLAEIGEDISPYDRDRNVFHAILNSSPVSIHGPLKELRLVAPDVTHTIHLDQLSQQQRATFRPIRFKRMSHTWVNGESQGPQLVGIDFGFQWRDENGKNQQEVLHFGEASPETMPEVP